MFKLEKTKKRMQQWNKALGVGLALVLLLGAVPSTASLGETSPLNSQDQAERSKEDADLLAVKEASETQGPQGRLVVKLSQDASPEAIAQSVQAELIRKGPLQFITLALEPSRMDEAMAELKAMPGVLTVSPSQVMKITGAAESSSAKTLSVDDPYYLRQWGLTQTQVPEAWDLGATGKGIVVAVVDTGVDVEHPDLHENLVAGYNAITGREGLNVIQDNNGHGTHVAGIIAAKRDESGIIGVAYDAVIMPIKAMDRHGEGNDYEIADGIVWAADHGADIINLSFGSKTQEEILSEAIEYAYDQGCLIIASAGNKDEESEYTAITYPAADPKVLAVTATDEKDQLASFSLAGPNAGLAAPGTNIMSDYWQDTSAYGLSDGTSMAAPFVSGAAALVWSQHSNFSAAQVRQVLEDSAFDLGNPGRDEAYGYGRIDAYWAVRFAKEPASISAPARVSWAGGILHGSSGQTAAQLEIPARAFGSDPLQTPQISLSTPAGTASTAGVVAGLPAGVNPIGEPLEITIEASTPVQKYLRLSLTPGPGSFAPDSSRLLYIYRWTGSRWLKVGGGMKEGTVTVGITEPGIYQMGSAAVPQESRLAGADRQETAILISQYGFPEGADTVILARSGDFPDALAGAPLAYKKHGPILLTESNRLPESVLSEIQRLNPQEIILLGGTGAISEEIESGLASRCKVARLGGATRYDTARQIALELGMAGEAVIVNGDNFPDAISISSIAAQYGVPILLTARHRLPVETNQVLRQFAVTWTAAVGGTGVISANTFDFLPNPVRLSGSDRYATATEVLNAFPPQGSLAFLATGENFPDALTGGVLAALNSTNLILVSPAGLNQEEQSVLQGWSGKKVYAFGGSSIVSDSLFAQVQALVQ